MFAVLLKHAIPMNLIPDYISNPHWNGGRDTRGVHVPGLRHTILVLAHIGMEFNAVQRRYVFCGLWAVRILSHYSDQMKCKLK